MVVNAKSEGMANAKGTKKMQMRMDPRFKIPAKLRFVAAPKSERSWNLNRNFRWVPAFFLQLKPQLEVSQLKLLQKRPL